MFGIVLWCDKLDGKAIFWCEDQGELAFYEGPHGNINVMWGEAVDLDVGDMVGFELLPNFKVRRAANPKLLKEKGCSQSPGQLYETATQIAEEPPESSKVLLFKGRPCHPVPELVELKA